MSEELMLLSIDLATCQMMIMGEDAEEAKFGKQDPTTLILLEDVRLLVEGNGPPVSEGAAVVLLKVYVREALTQVEKVLKKGVES